MINNMETVIQLLYNEVLSELPFSLTGHVDFEDKLNNFYNKLANSQFITKSGITLLFSAILDIPYNSHEINEWNLKSFHDIFYKTIGETNKEEAISFYFHMLKWAGEKVNRQKFSTSLILSKFFISDVNFRVNLFDQTEPFVHYNPDTDCFLIEMPRNLLNTDGGLGVKLKLDSIWNGKEKYIENNVHLKGIFSIKERLDNENHCIEVFNKIYNTKMINKAIISIIKQFKNFSNYDIGKDLYKVDESLFKEMAYCSICLSFLCWYYDSKIEYMLSIAKSDSSFQNNSKTEHRNIGGLVIGYRLELNDLTRAMFDLISDRISAAVGGQHLVESNKKAKVETARFKFKQFCTIIDGSDPKYSILGNNESEQIHGNARFDETSISKIKSLINSYERWLGEDFVAFFKLNAPVFSKYLTIICSQEKQVSGDANNVFSDKRCRFRQIDDTCDCIYCRLMKEIREEEEKVGYYLNLPLIDNLVSTFEKYPKTDLQEVLIIDDKIILKYVHQINVTKFIALLNTAKSKSFTGFIQDNCLPLLSMGVVSITDINGVEKFNLEDWFVLKDKYNSEQEIEILSGFQLIITLKHKIQCEF